MSRRAPRHPKAGRRSKLTDTLAEQIITLVRAGNYVTTAAAACGVTSTTVWQWARQGIDAQTAIDNGEQLPPQALRYAAFAAELSRARADAEVTAIEVVQRSMRGGELVKRYPVVSQGKVVYDADGEILWAEEYSQPDGKLALEYAARSSPERWGRTPTAPVGVDEEPRVAASGGEGRVAELADRLLALTAERAAEDELVVDDAEVVDDDAGQTARSGWTPPSPDGA